LKPLAQVTAENYKEQARYPASSAPLTDGVDPVLRDWTVSPSRTRGPEGEEPSLTIYPAAVSFEAPEPVVLHAFLSESGSRRAAEVLDGTITGENGAVALLEFRDDGQGGDPTAGDHLYTAVFTPPDGWERSYAGIYSVAIRAMSEKGEERFATSAFQYSAPDSRLTGRFEDRIVDGNLEIRAEVEVSAPGRFHLEGTLHSLEDRPVAWAQESVTLKPGLHWIALSFYGLALNESRSDGPYVLRYLVLSTTSTMPNSMNRPLENAHVTAPYRAISFTSRPFDDPQLLEEARRLLRLSSPRE
jgi:hypothetical protein